MRSETFNNKVTSTLHPYSTLDKLLFIVSFILFFSSVVIFGLLQNMPQAKYFFYSSLFLFVVFFIKRIKSLLYPEVFSLIELGPNTIKIFRLKSIPFFETELGKVVTINHENINKVTLNVVGGGGMPDPSIWLVFELNDKTEFIFRYPFQLVTKVAEIIELLKENFEEIQFEIDKSF